MSLLDTLVETAEEDFELRREYVNLWITVRQLTGDGTLMNSITPGNDAFERYYYRTIGGKRD